MNAEVYKGLTGYEKIGDPSEEERDWVTGDGFCVTMDEIDRMWEWTNGACFDLTAASVKPHCGEECSECKAAMEIIKKTPFLSGFMRDKIKHLEKELARFKYIAITQNRAIDAILTGEEDEIEK